MTKVPPATDGAQIATLASESEGFYNQNATSHIKGVGYSNRDVTKVPAATVGSQIAFLISKSSVSFNRNMTKVLLVTVGAQVSLLQIGI